jgi:hypothetical protein
VKKLAGENRRLVINRAAEATRESALLWFVFSALDALISRRLTVPWLTLNTCGAFVVWAIGMYFEIRAKEMK